MTARRGPATRSGPVSGVLVVEFLAAVLVVVLVTLGGVGLAPVSDGAGLSGHALIAAPTTTTGAQEPARPGQRVPTRGPVGSDPSPTRSVPLNLVGGLILGAPIIRGDFADPYALAESSGLFVYATNTVDANVPVIEIHQGDVVDASYLGDALPTLPSWTVKGFQWGPSVWARPDGRFVLYYSTPAPPAAAGQPRRQCISRAVADAPAGPFVDDSAAPFICPIDQGGAIDPSVFVEGTTPYLLWKADGNCCGLPTSISSQPLSPDGLAVAGPPHQLITADQPWEGSIVEGPSMVKAGDNYELFYSANNWDSSSYAVGLALCPRIDGPCTKPLDHAWMASAQDFTGPGGEEFFANPGGVWMVHHGFLPGQAGTPDGQRRLYLDLLHYQGSDPIPTRAGARQAEDKVAQLLAVVGAVVLVAGVGGFVVLRRRHRRRRAG